MKTGNFTLIAFLLILLCGELSAQPLPKQHHKSVYGNGYYVGASDYDYQQFTKGITGSATSKYDKAKLIYSWICKNIVYDTTSNLRSADKCYDAKRAVCQGYCELFYRMAESIGIECTLVYGKSKVRNSSGYEDHAWIYAKTEHGNILIDPTWGAGTVVSGRFVSSANPDEWFDVNPKWMILTHLPDRGRNTMLGVDVSENTFKTFPYCTPLYEKLGFSPDTIINKSLKGVALSFPQFLSNTNLSGVEFVSIPKTATLSTKEKYTFCINHPNGVEIIIKNGKTTYTQKDFTKVGNSHTINIKPTERGELTVFIVTKTNFFAAERPILTYTVE